MRLNICIWGFKSVGSSVRWSVLEAADRLSEVSESDIIRQALRTCTVLRHVIFVAWDTASSYTALMPIFGQSHTNNAKSLVTYGSKSSYHRYPVTKYLRDRQKVYRWCHCHCRGFFFVSRSQGTQVVPMCPSSRKKKLDDFLSMPSWRAKRRLHSLHKTGIDGTNLSRKDTTMVTTINLESETKALLFR